MRRLARVRRPVDGRRPGRDLVGDRGRSPGPFVPGDGDRAGLVDLGGGRELYLECSGTGGPTVVFISGAGVAADDWSYVGDPTDAAEPAVPDASAVFPRTAGFTTACAYDRPGTEQMEGAAGRSTPAPQPTTSQASAADLDAMLTAAEVPGPYVLVAHSLGGIIATTFARTHPDEVAGLVLVDPGSQYLQAALPPDVWSAWMETIAAAGAANPDSEAPDYPASIAALEGTPPLPAGIPVVVLSADRPFDYLGIGDADAYWPNWLEAASLLAASFGAPHVTGTSSGHFIANENPALVVDQVCAMVPAC
ncbi:alpha/beta fold hydrolase [Agromyces sp. MMS24-JH15]|uniref:alpha/beta fold hydrolase n=1 Tax=Agromyces sp. MMS24-JH15 TaxID=3243765 RepID=UPI003747C8DF